MPQLTRTVDDVIVNALYLIGELGVGETPDAFMLTTGLELINELLDKFSSDSIYIPFLTELDFTFQVGKGTYSFSDMVPSDVNADRIVDLSFANYTFFPPGGTSIVYPLKIITKAQYFNVTRIPSLQTRPGYCYLDKQAAQSFVVFYPVPDQPYLCNLHAKVMINELQDQDTLLSLPPFYYGFLKYAIAKKFRSYYPSSNWTEENESEYQDYYTNLKNANETDLTIRSSAILDVYQPIYWPPSIMGY